MYRLANFIAVTFSFVMLQSCAGDTEIKSFNIKFTDQEIFVDLQLINDTTSIPDSFLLSSKGIDSTWLRKLEKSCKKNDVTYEYDTDKDTVEIFLKLKFNDNARFKNFLLDMGFDNTISSFPLYINYRTSSDSVNFEMEFNSSVLTKRNYISIETPTDNTRFIPETYKHFIQTEKVSSNKMYFQIIRLNRPIWHNISCSYKKNKRKSSLKESEESLILFGYSKKYWEFWGILIGGLASIVTVIAFLLNLLKRR